MIIQLSGDKRVSRKTVAAINRAVHPRARDNEQKDIFRGGARVGSINLGDHRNRGDDCCRWVTPHHPHLRHPHERLIERPKIEPRL